MPRRRAPTTLPVVLTPAVVALVLRQLRGKAGKDRVTVLPQALEVSLRDHLIQVRALARS